MSLYTVDPSVRQVTISSYRRRPRLASVDPALLCRRVAVAEPTYADFFVDLASERAPLRTAS